MPEWAWCVSRIQPQEENTMNAALNTIEMKVDAQALVNNLKLAFTSKTTFISELLQNSRRAGASEIHVTYDKDDDILTVSDNGKGIEDLQNLLNVAHSGWDDEIKASETPYGMGFLSALFAASHVEVASRGKIVAFDTADAMSFKQIPVHDCDVHEGTLVIMKGALADTSVHRTMKGALADCSVYRTVQVIPSDYTRGFPIPVYLNGEELSRDHAIDQREFFETDIGLVYIRNLNDGEYPVSDFTFYLQGQDVTPKSIRAYSRPRNIVHLDPTQFKGRLPDRDVLIDEHERHASKRAKEIWAQAWRKHFEGKKAEMDSADFATKCFSQLKTIGAIDLLDDLDVIPLESLIDIDQYPAHLWEWEGEGSRPSRPIARSKVESGEIKVVMAVDYKEIDGGFQLANFLYHCDEVLVYEGNLGRNHWIHDYLIDTTNDDISVRLNGVQKVTGVGGPQYGYRDAVFCESIELSHPTLGSVEVKDDAMNIVARPENVHGLTDEQREQARISVMENAELKHVTCLIAIPDGENDGSVVRQCHTFEGEFGALEEDAEDETQAFSRFILSHRPGAEIEAIRRALVHAGISDMSSLWGKRFEIEINDDPKSAHLGSIKVTEK